LALFIKNKQEYKHHREGIKKEEEPIAKLIPGF
jgi:hypothetical protein